jgi:hypothetical protein
MTYRNDHDAALHRADALERDLAAARQRSQADKAKIAQLEAQLASLRAAARIYTTPPPVPPPVRAQPSGARIAIGLTAGLISVLAIAAGGHHHTPSYTPPPRYEPPMHEFRYQPPPTFSDAELQLLLHLEPPPTYTPDVYQAPPPPPHRHHHHRGK